MDGGLGGDRGLGRDWGLSWDRGLGVQELQVAVGALPCHSWGRRAVSCVSSSAGMVTQTLVECIPCTWNCCGVCMYSSKQGFEMTSFQIINRKNLEQALSACVRF